ncbi:MAG: DUF998 domain-containing protein [Thermoplasmata archaeon]|nr:MAG: DUF998 domain-containing protein [Thermoplasmata archaeon]
MTGNSFVSTRISGLCGILAPIIGLTCIALAILLCPWFSWTENYLSDLGGSPGDRPIWAAHGMASVLFNCGLVIAGVLGVCFVVGMRKIPALNSRLGKIGSSFYLMDACALIGIGIFPESTGAPHTFFSITFFILVGVSLVFIGMALKKKSERTLGWLAFALLAFGLIAVPLFFMPQPSGSNAIAEMIPIISIAIFSMVFGYRLYDQGQDGGKKEMPMLRKSKELHLFLV